MRRALLLSLMLAPFGRSAAAPPAAGVQACIDATTPETLLKSPADLELYDYAACSELVTGRTDLCDTFPGGPSSLAEPKKEFTVVRSDGKVHEETEYGVCVSRAAGHRFLQLLVGGAAEADLLPPLRRMLYGEEVPAEDVLRASVQAWRTKSLKDSARPDLARLGFFNHLLGKGSCRKVKESKLREDCVRKASTIEALRAKDASRCLPKDFLCRELVNGPGVCRAIGERIVRRHCGAAPGPALKEGDPDS